MHFANFRESTQNIINILKASYRKDRPAWILFFVFTVLMGLFMILAYRTFAFPVLDLGMFNRHMYSLSRFDFSPNPLKGFNLLGDHAHLFLFFLIPFYWVWPAPGMLLFVQTLAITLSIFPIYYIVKHYLKSSTASVLWTIAYMMFFGIWAAVMYSFHDSPVAVLPISWALYHLLVSKKSRLLILWLIILCLVREDMPLVAVMFGVYTAVFDRRWLVGMGIVAGSLFYMSAIMTFLIPSFGPGYAYSENPFGRGMGDVALAFATKPFVVLKCMFWSPKAKFDTIYYMILSFGGLSLIAPQVLILMLPLWMGRTITNQPNRWRLYQHYTASQAPFLVVSAIVGLATLIYLLNRYKVFSKKTLDKLLIIISVFVVALSTVIMFKTKNNGILRIVMPSSYALGETQKSVYEAMKLISPNASLGVQSPFPQLTSRKEIYNLPLGENQKPKYVFMVDAIDRYPFRSSDKIDEYVKSLTLNSKYRIIYDKNKVFLLERND